MSLDLFIRKLNIVNPKSLKVFYDEIRNSLQIKINDRAYLDVLPRRPFPLSRPEFIILYTRDGEEICIIKNYKELDNKSKENLERMLAKVYFIPKIIAIKDISYKTGRYFWKVITDHGKREFKTVGRRSMMKISDNRIIVIDTSDNIYEINIDKMSKKDLDKLDLVL